MRIPAIEVEEKQAQPWKWGGVVGEWLCIISNTHHRYVVY